MIKDSTKGSHLSIKDLNPVGRGDADTVREQLEQRGMTVPKGSPVKSGRIVAMSIKTFPHIKEALYDMAAAERKDMIEILEDAVQLRLRTMRGGK